MQDVTCYDQAALHQLQTSENNPLRNQLQLYNNMRQNIELLSLTANIAIIAVTALRLAELGFNLHTHSIIDTGLGSSI